jgi:antitoxin PrlF
MTQPPVTGDEVIDRSPFTYKVKSSTLYLTMKSVISSKGQITIPAEIRSKLGLRPGTQVTFELTDRGAFLQKGRQETDAVAEVYGILKSNRHTDKILDELRGPRPRVKRAKRR